MCGALALAFILTTAAEVYVLVKVGALLGAMPTLAVIIATGMVGAWLAKRAGTRALLRLRESLGTGGTSLALVDGALVLAAGVALLSPGFLTDVCGLLLLVTPVRGPIAGWLYGKLAGRMGNVVTFGMADVSGTSEPGTRNESSDADPPPPGVIDV